MIGFNLTESSFQKQNFLLKAFLGEKKMTCMKTERRISLSKLSLGSMYEKARLLAIRFDESLSKFVHSAIIGLKV